MIEESPLLTDDASDSVNDIVRKLHGFGHTAHAKHMIELFEMMKDGLVKKILHVDPSQDPNRIAVYQGRHSAYSRMIDLIATTKEPLEEDDDAKGN